jgi:hypothetical protein
MNNSNFEVALAKEVCQVCAKQFDGPIIMNERLTEQDAKQVRELHGKAIGYMKEPCEECQGFMEQGVVVIGIDPKNSDDMSNPYRTGDFVVVKDAFFEKQFGINDDLDRTLNVILDKRVTFMDSETMIKFGLKQVE